MCQRELVLADMLKKPIVPVMFEMTVWPPIGAAGLILSPLTYVDLKGKVESVDCFLTFSVIFPYFICPGAGGHGGSGKNADLQARYNEIASIVARHTTSSSPTTFRRLVHSSSLDQRGTPARPTSTLANLTAGGRQAKQLRNRRHHNIESIHSNERSISSMSEDDYDDDDDNDSDTSEHPSRPIEPILTVPTVGPPVTATLNQPFQIRSSVHLEHRLGPMTINHQPATMNNRVVSRAACSIL